MKIKELIKLLKQQDKEANVYISGDNIGNYFSEIDKNYGVEKHGNCNFVTLYPLKEGLDYNDLI